MDQGPTSSLMFRVHEGGDVIATKQVKNLQHYGFASDDERQARQRVYARQRLPPNKNEMDAMAKAASQTSLEEIRAHIQAIDEEVSGRERRAWDASGVRLPAITVRRDGGQRAGAKTGKSVSFYHSITSLGTSLASGSSLRSRSAIRLAAGQSAITVLPDLKEELCAERDRLASVLGQAPGLAPIRTAVSPHESMSFGGITRSSNSVATMQGGRVEHREMGVWLDGLVTSLKGQPRREVVRPKLPSLAEHRVTRAVRGEPWNDTMDDIPLLPSTSTFVH